MTSRHHFSIGPDSFFFLELEKGKWKITINIFKNIFLFDLSSFAFYFLQMKFLINEHYRSHVTASE